jgi:hypothetical protein
MAMFNFELGGQQEPRKMRSYIDIDSAGKPTARIYADEYDSVKSNPDFAPFLTGAGRSVAREQTVDDMIAEEKMSDVERRIEGKRREAVAADLQATRAAAEDNVYYGPDFLGSLGGIRKTYKEKAETKKQELQALLEEQAGYEGTPEVSAPMERVGIETQAEQPAPVSEEYISLRGPDGRTQRIKKSLWTQPSPKDPTKKVSEIYLQSGYSVIR